MLGLSRASQRLKSIADRDCVSRHLAFGSLRRSNGRIVALVSNDPSLRRTEDLQVGRYDLVNAKSFPVGEVGVSGRSH